MNNEVFITCAVTGAGENARKSDKVPITPEAIADDALAAAAAGAAIAHIHVRDPETGEGSRRVDLYREVVERIREKNTELIINLTAGMGGDLVIGNEDPLEAGKGTDFVSALERLAHVEELLPDICTLDCGSYNVGEGSLVYVATSKHIRAQARRIWQLGVKPEIEVFELGHLNFALQLLDEGELEAPVLIQFCLGVPCAAPAVPESLQAMRSLVAGHDVVWSAFGVGRMEMPVAALATIMGGNVRVGLEDNLYLRRGVLASNAELVKRAASLIEHIGCSVMNAARTRQYLGLSEAA